MNTAMDVNKALATCARRTAGTAAYRAGYGNTELVVGFAAGVIGGGVEGSGATTVGGAMFCTDTKASLVGISIAASEM